MQQDLRRVITPLQKRGAPIHPHHCNRFTWQPSDRRAICPYHSNISLAKNTPTHTSIQPTTGTSTQQRKFHRKRLSLFICRCHYCLSNEIVSCFNGVLVSNVIFYSRSFNAYCNVIVLK